jgi:hypothetical protein
MRELQRAIERLGRVPQTAATQGASAGAKIVRKAAKQNAPEDTGELKRGIILKRERKVKPGKAVYDVMMDPAMNDTFVKISLEGERSYYPASQEYGFLTVDGGYVPGFRYLRNSVEENARQVEKKIVEVALKKVDQAWARSRGR